MKFGGRVFFVCILGALLLPYASDVSASVPSFINYQSRLRDSDGDPITGTTTIQFSIYNDVISGTATDTPSSAGPLLWTETYNQATGSCAYIDPDSDGYLTVQLGACVSFPDYLDFTTDDLHLGVKIGSDAEATPRARLGSTPFSYTSEKVRGTGQSTIGTTTAANSAVLTIEATSTSAIAAVFRGIAGQIADIFQVIGAAGERFLTIAANGFLGVGTSTPSAQLTVDGDTALYGDLAVTGTTTFNGDVVPGVDDVYSLGTADLRWKDLYVGPGTIYVGNSTAFGTLGYSISDEYILFDPDGDTLHDIVFDYRGHVGIGTTSPNAKLTIDSGDFATGTVMEITDLTHLTTGTALHIDSNSSSTATRNLLEIFNTNPLAVNTTALLIDNPYGIAASFLGTVGIGTIGSENALTVEGGVTVSSSTPHTADSALYNLDGELYWSGLTVDTAFGQVGATNFQDTDPDSSTTNNTATIAGIGSGGDVYTDLWFSSDGTSLYLSNITGLEIIELSLISAYEFFLASETGATTTLPYSFDPQATVVTNSDTTLYVLDANSDQIIQYTLTTPGDITTASYVNATSVAAYTSNVVNMDLSSDGVELLVLSDTEQIDHFRMSTPYDIATLVHVSSTTMGFGSSLDPVDIAWSPRSGNRFYILEADNETIYEYQLGTEYDLSTITLMHSSADLNSLSPTAFAFNPNGEELYVLGNGGSGRDIYKYDVDLYNENLYGDDAVEFVYLDTDGSDQLAIGTSTAQNLVTIDGGVYLASTTPINTNYALYNLGGDLYWNGSRLSDLATTTFPELTVTGSTTLAELFVQGDSILDNNLTVYGETNLATTTIANLTVIGSSTLASLTVNDFFTVTGTTTFNGNILTPLTEGSVPFIGANGLLTEDNDNFFYEASSSRLSIGTSTLLATLTVAGDGYFTGGITLSSSTPINASSTLYALGEDLYWNGVTVDTAFEQVVGFGEGPTDLEEASEYLSLVLNASSSQPQGVTFSTDGRSAYVVGTQYGLIRQFNLTLPYQIGLVVGAGIFDVSSTTENPLAIAFNDDGSKMYLSSATSSGVIYEYDLDTNFDLSGTTTLSATSSIVFPDPDIVSMEFNADGTKLFYLGNTNETIYEYDLSSAYDINTLSYSDELLLSSIDDPYGMTFIESGMRLWVSDDTNNTIYEYELDTPYTLASSSLSAASYDFTDSETQPRDIAANSDGSVLVLVGESGPDLTQFEVPNEVGSQIPGAVDLVYLNPDQGDGFLALGTSTAQNLLTVNGGIYLASTTPANVISALYNIDNSLYWNGSELLTLVYDSEDDTYVIPAAVPIIIPTSATFKSNVTHKKNVTHEGDTIHEKDTKQYYGNFEPGSIVFMEDECFGSGALEVCTGVPFLSEDNEFLHYDWRNRRVGIGTDNPTNALTVDGTAEFQTGIITSYLDQGVIPFIGINQSLRDTVGLYWDDANGYLGVGTSSPEAKAHIHNGSVLVTEANPLQVSAMEDSPLGNCPTCTLANASDVAMRGNYALVTSRDEDELAMIDISDPANPVQVSVINGASPLANPTSVAVLDNYAYVTDSENDALYIFDISIPVVGPTQVGAIQNTDCSGNHCALTDPESVYVTPNYAYVASPGSDGVAIIDTSDKTNPTHVTSLIASTTGQNLDGAYDVVVNNDTAYVVNFTANNLLTFDVSNLSNPNFFGVLAHGTGGADLYSPQDIVIHDHYAYIIAATGLVGSTVLEIVDITNPAAPEHVGKTSTFHDGSCLLNCPSDATDIAIAGDFAYITFGIDDLVVVVDISDPSDPQYVGEAISSSNSKAIEISGKYAFVAAAASSQFQIFELAGVKAPAAEFGSLAVDNGIFHESLTVTGNLSAKTIETSLDGLKLDGAQAGGVFFAGSGGAITQSPTAFFFDTSTSYLGLGTNQPTELLHINNGNMLITAGEPIVVGILDDGTCDGLQGGDGCPLDGASSVHVLGNYAYVSAQDDDGFAIIDITRPSKPTYVNGEFDTVTEFIDGATDIYVQGEYAYVTSGTENSLSLYNVLDPSFILPADSITDADCDAAVGGEGCALDSPQAVIVDGNYAYVLSYGDRGIAVIDVTDTSNPSHVASLFASSTPAALLNGVFNMYLRNGHLYIPAGTDGALTIIDVTNPQYPTWKSSVTSTVNELQGAFDVEVRGHYAYVVSTISQSLSIIDVFDTSSTSIAGYFSQGDCTGTCNLNIPTGIALAGDYAYITTETNDGIEVINIGDLTNLTHVAFLADDDDALLVSPSDIEIVGKYAYVTAAGEDGLTVIDIHGLRSPSGDISKLAVDDLMVRESLFVQSRLEAQTIFAGTGGITSDGDLKVNSSNVTVYDGNILVEEKAPVVTRVYTDSECNSDFSGSECTIDNSQAMEIDPQGTFAFISSFSENGITKINIEDADNPQPVAELTDDVTVHLGGISGMELFSIVQENDFENNSDISDDSDVAEEVLIVLSKTEDAVSVVSSADETDFEMSVLSDITDVECDAIVPSGCALGGPDAMESFVMVDGYWAMVGSDDESGVAIMNVSDPNNIKHETSLFASTTLFESQPVPLNDPDAIMVRGDHAYVSSGDEDSVVVINVSQPRNPVVVDVIEDGVDGAQMDNPLAFEIRGDFMYIASNDANAVEVYDITIPEAAQYVGRLEASTSTPMGPPNDLTITGDTMLVGTDNGVTEVDISNAANPEIRGSIVDNSAGGAGGPDGFETTNLANVSDVETDRGKAYAVSLTENALTIMSMRNVTAPAGIFDNLWVRGDMSLDGAIKTDLLTIDGSADVLGNLFAENIGVRNQLAVNGKVSVFDGDLLQTIKKYTPLGTYDGEGELSGPTDIAVDPYDDIAYIINPTTDTVTTVDVGESDNPSLVSSLTDAVCDSGSGGIGCSLDNPVAIDIKDDHLVIAADAEDALSVFDVSSTSSEPEIVFRFNDELCDNNNGNCPMNYISDMEIDGDLVFTINNPPGGEDEGFGITELRDDGSLLYLGSVPEEPDVNLAGPGSIEINDDIAYVISSSDDGLTVIDLGETNRPEVIGTLKFDSAEVPGLIDATDVAFHDDTLYITSGVDNQLGVIDVSDPENPEYVVTLDNDDLGEDFDHPEQIARVGGTLLITVSEGDALTVLDISFPEDPQLVSVLKDNESLELDGAHGITVDDDAIYVTGRTDNGLQILELPRIDAMLATIDTIYGVDGFFNRLSVSDWAEFGDITAYGDVEVFGDVRLRSASFNQELDVLDPLGNADDSAGGLADPIAVEVGEDDEVAFVISAIEDRLTVFDLRQPTNPAFQTGYDDTLCEAQAGIGECTMDGLSAMDREGSRLAIAGDIEDGITLLDISSSTDPQFISAISDAECDFAFITGSVDDDCALTNITDLEMIDNFIYTVNDDDLEEEGFGIIEIDGDGYLTVRGALFDDVPRGLGGGGFVEVADDIAYVISIDDDVLTAIDISDKDNPSIIGTEDGLALVALDEATDMELYDEEGVIYITDGFGDRLFVIDVSVPEAMVEAVTLSPSNDELPPEFNHPSSLERIGERLIVTARDGDAVLVFDISDPDNPKYLWSLTDTDELELDGPETIALGEGMMLVASTEDDGFEVFKVPTINSMIAQIDTIFADDISARDIDVDTIEVQEKLTVRGKTEAYDDVSLQGASLEVVVGGNSAFSQIGARVDTTERLLAGAYDIVVQGTKAFVAARNDDAISIWDVSDPTDMVELFSVADDSVLLLDGIEAVDVDGDLLVVGSSIDDAITLFDISDPTDPVILSSLEDAECNSQATALRPGNPGCPFVGMSDVEIHGNYVFTTSVSEQGVAAIDITDPKNPQFVDSIENPECDDVHSNQCALGGATDIEISGNYAFVAANSDDGVAILNISDPQNMYHATSVIDTSDRSLGGPTSITLDGNYIYVTAEDESGFVVIDITNPEAPVYVTELGNAQCDSDTSEECALFGATDSTVVGDYLYVSAPLDYGISVFDMSDPTEPQYIDSLIDGAQTLLDGVTSLTTGAGLIFAATGLSEDGFAAFSIPSISAPTGIFTYLETAVMNVLSNLNIGNNLSVVGNGDFRGDLASAGLTVQGNGVYSYGDITVDDDTLHFERSYTPASCNEDAEDETCTFVTPVAMSVDGDRMVLAYDGTSNLDGFTVFDLSNPTDPSWAATVVHNNSGTVLPTLDGTEDVVVRGDYLYYLASNAIGVVDVTDATAPTTTDHYEDSECDADVGGAGCALSFGGLGEDMVVDGNYAYITAGSDQGIGIFDISDPNNIVHVASIFDDADSILQRFNGIEYHNGYVYVITDTINKSMDVVDVTDPNNPVHVRTIVHDGSSIFLDDSEALVAVSNHLYVGSADGIMVFDISSSTNPVAAGFLLEDAETNLTDIEGLSVIDERLYVATEEGLTVLDISDPTTPVQSDRSLDTNDRAMSDLIDLVIVGDYVYTLSNDDAGISIFSVGNRITTPTLVTDDIFINGQISTNFTDGAMLFSNNGIIADTGGELHWDTDNNRLGIGVDDPTAGLSVRGGIEVRLGAPDTTEDALYHIDDGLYWDGEQLTTAFNEVRVDTTVYGLDLTGVSLVADEVVTGETNNLGDISFSSDGHDLYVVGEVGGDSELVQYELTTAFDISTKIFVGSTSINAFSQDAVGGVMSNSGTHFYVSADHDNSISVYELPTPFDISVLNFAGKIVVTSYDDDPAGLALNDIDTKLYLVGRGENIMVEYEMTEPNDLSTASVVATSTFSDSTTLRDVSFTEGGQQMFVVYNGDDTAYLYNLTNAYDISSRNTSAAQSYDYGSDENATRAVYANGDEQLLIVAGQAGFGAGDSIHAYSTGQTSGVRTDDLEYVFYDPYYGDGRLAIGQRTAPNLLSVNGGIYLASTTPANTNDALYNLGSNLYWNGNQFLTGDGGANLTSLTVFGTSTLATTSITNLTVSGSSTLNTLLATGNTILNQNLTVYGTTTVSSTTIPALFVDGSTTTIANLIVTGTTTLATTTINGDLLTNLATGSVTFIGKNGLLTEDNNNFFYEASTTRLGIGTSTPTSTLTVDGDMSIYDRLYALGESIFSRLATFNDALTIASTTPSATSSSLYNLSNTLYWNGLSVDTAFEQVPFTTEAVEEVLPYDVSATVFRHSTSTLNETSNPLGIRFNDDGTKLFVASVFSVFEYSLSVPYDISSSVFSTSTGNDLIPQDPVFYGLDFNDDGTKLYTLGATTFDIFEYDLASPYDVSSTTLVQSTSTNEVIEAPRSITFNNDGTRLFVTGIATSSGIYTFTLSTPYDISTTNFLASTTLVEDETPVSMRFNASGTELFVTGSEFDAVYQYALGAPFDLGAATFLRSTSTAAEDLNMIGLEFNASGTAMYLSGVASGAIYEYEITLVDGVESETIENSVELVYLDPEVGAGRLAIGTNTATSTLTIDGDVSIFDRLYAYGETLFDQLATFSDALTVATGVPSATSSSIYNQDGTLFWSGLSVDTAFEQVALKAPDTASTSGSFNVDNLAFVQSTTTAAEDTIIRSFRFNDDGTKLFLLGNVGNRVYEYDLSIPYDISTTIFSTSSISFGDDNNQVDIEFNNDGTKLYIVGNQNNRVYEYDLTSPFDVSSTTFVQFFNTSPETQPRTVTFNDDGTKMYISGRSTDTIREYFLASPYSISSAFFLHSTSTLAQDDDVRGHQFNNDGTKMFIAGNQNDAIIEYDLGTAYDVSTAAFVRSSSTPQDTSIVGLEFNADGSAVYVTGDDNDAIYQYSMTVTEIIEGEDIENSSELVYLQPEVGSGFFALGTTTAHNLLTVQGGAFLASTTPLNTAYALYNQAGTLYWDGTALVTQGGSANLASLTVTGTTTGTNADFTSLTISGSTTLATLFASSTTLADLFVTGSTTLNTLSLAGALYDGFNNPGTDGFVLQSTGSSTQWVATSTLGLGSGSSLWTQNGADIYFNTGNVGIGTTTPEAQLEIVHVGTGNYQRALKVLTPNAADGNNAGGIFFGRADANSELAHMTFVADSSNYDNNYINFGFNSHANKMVITQGGNVGIGTTSPTTALTVAGSGYVTDGFGIGRIQTTPGVLSIDRSAGDSAIVFHEDGTAVGQIRGDSGLGNINITNVAGSNAYLSIDTNTGRVGIGTTSPERLLHISDAASPRIYVTDTTNGVNAQLGAQNNEAFVGSQSNHDLRLLANNSEVIRLTTGGNVGIGTTSPTQTLTVDGNQYLTGALFDSQNSSGTAGYVLQSTGSGIAWVASTSLQASSLWTQNGNDIYYNTGNVGIGTTTPTADLFVYGSTGQDLFRIATSTNPSIFTVNESGEVGIGKTQTDPQSKLTVASLGGNEFQTGLLLSNPDNTNDGGTATGILFDVSNNSDRPKAGIAFERLDSNARGTLHFLQNNVADDTDATLSDAVMSIDSLGNVGIGTTTPVGQLHIQNDGSFIDNQVFLSNGLSDPLLTHPIGYRPSLAIASMEQSGSRPLFVGYQNANGWNGFAQMGACGAFDQMCFSMGASTTDYTALASHNDDLAIGGRSGLTSIFNTMDGEFNDVYFGNTGNLFIPNGRVQIGGGSATSWVNDSITGYTDGFHTNDAAIFAPVNSGGISDLRLYVVDDDVDSFSIWGDTCGGGDCGTLDNASVIAHFQGGGNVGIGTTSPQSRLDIKSPGSTDVFRIISSGDTDPLFTISEGGAGNPNFNIYKADGDNVIRFTSAGDSFFNTGGNVGIGTTTPRTQLDIYETDGDAILTIEADADNSTEGDNPAIRLIQDGGLFSSYLGFEGNANTLFTNSRSNALILGTENNSPMQLMANGTSTFIIDTDWETGIGVFNNPVSTLHVYEDSVSNGTGAGLTIEQDGTGDAIAQFLLGASGQRWVIGADNSSNDRFRIASTFGLGSDTRFTIETDGKIGIGGATNPDTLFHIESAEDFSDPFAGPIITLAGDSIDQEESGRIRFQENSSNFRGMYIHYNGSGNDLHIGGHSATDSATSSDVNTLTIEREGQVGVYDTTPDEELTVVGGFCVKDAAGDTCSTGNGSIDADGSINANNFDLAENFLTEDETLEPGEVVMMDPDNPVTHIVRADDAETMSIGVVSTAPSMVMGYAINPDEFNEEDVRPVALSGRVPVKVNLDNDEINTGDRLTLSETPGVAMRSTEATDHIIGIALEPYDTEGAVSTAYAELIGTTTAPEDIILMLVENNPASQFALDLETFLGATESTSTLLALSTDDSEYSFGRLADRIATLVLAGIEEMGVRIAEAAVYVNDLFAETIVVDNLTVGSEANPSGITFYDETGAPYCVKVLVGGELASVAGECGSETTDETTNTPSEEPQDVGGGNSETEPEEAAATSTPSSSATSTEEVIPVATSTSSESIATSTENAADSEIPPASEEENVEIVQEDVSEEGIEEPQAEETEVLTEEPAQETEVEEITQDPLTENVE